MLNVALRFLLYVSLTSFFFSPQYDREAVSCQFCRGVVSSFLLFLPFILLLCGFEILLGTMHGIGTLYIPLGFLLLLIFNSFILVLLLLFGAHCAGF